MIKNILIRTELGRQVRETLAPKAPLVDVDYSVIERRISDRNRGRAEMVWVLTFTGKRKRDEVSRDKVLILRAARHWRSFGYSVRVDRMPLKMVNAFDPWQEPVCLRRSGPFMSKREVRQLRRWLAARKRSEKR